MSSYCPLGLYFSMNNVNYYYCQSCDPCDYVCVAINETPNCGGCCCAGCTEGCPGLITNADHPMVTLLKDETIATLPAADVEIPDYVDLDPSIRTYTSPISIDTDDSVSLVDDNREELCKLRLIGVRVGIGDGNNWRVLHVGQQLSENARVNGTVKKTMKSTGKYHRVKFDNPLDTRAFDVITKDDVDDAPPALAPAPVAARQRRRGAR